VNFGANRGNRIEIFLSLGARVVALEPQPDCVESLKSTYSRNPLVTIVPLAVGEKEGEQEMFISDASTISTMSSDWIAGVKESGRFKEFSWEKKDHRSRYNPGCVDQAAWRSGVYKSRCGRI
jgi:FkbM family methyltransferase